MNGAALARRVDAAIKRIGGMDRLVYLRTQTNITGDALTGRTTSTTVDTLISPQPVYVQLGKRDLVYLTGLGKQVTADDYKLTLSPLSLTKSQLEDKTAQFVLKDPTVTGSEEVLRIIYVNSTPYQGTVVALTIIARSTAING